MHGGAAPQVKAAAKIRLLAMVEPAIKVLAAAMRDQKHQPGIALAAARDVLDRAGLMAEAAEATGGGTTFQLVLMQAGQTVDSPEVRTVDIRALIKE